MHVKRYRQVADLFLIQNENIIILLNSTASYMVSFGYFNMESTRIRRKIYYLQDTLLHSTYKLQVFIKFSYLGDHVLPTKLRSERCANDLNHFQLQLKVPSGTFSIAEISLSQMISDDSCIITAQSMIMLSPKAIIRASKIDLIGVWLISCRCACWRLWILL